MRRQRYVAKNRKPRKIAFCFHDNEEDFGPGEDNEGMIKWILECEKALGKVKFYYWKWNHYSAVEDAVNNTFYSWCFELTKLVWRVVLMFQQNNETVTCWESWDYLYSVLIKFDSSIMLLCYSLLIWNDAWLRSSIMNVLCIFFSWSDSTICWFRMLQKLAYSDWLNSISVHSRLISWYW